MESKMAGRTNKIHPSLRAVWEPGLNKIPGEATSYQTSTRQSFSEKLKQAVVRFSDTS